MQVRFKKMKYNLLLILLCSIMDFEIGPGIEKDDIDRITLDMQRDFHKQWFEYVVKSPGMFFSPDNVRYLYEQNRLHFNGGKIPSWFVEKYEYLFIRQSP